MVLVRKTPRKTYQYPNAARARVNCIADLKTATFCICVTPFEFPNFVLHCSFSSVATNLHKVVVQLVEQEALAAAIQSADCQHGDATLDLAERLKRLCAGFRLPRLID